MTIIHSAKCIGIQAVLALAGSAAGIAAYALLGVDDHSIAGHHAPTFMIVTTASWVMAEP